MFERRNSIKKAEAEQRAGSAEPSIAESRAARKKLQSPASLHLFSNGNYFHRVLSSELNINPKIIIEIFSQLTFFMNKSDEKLCWLRYLLYLCNVRKR